MAPSCWQPAYVGIGSNLGNPAEHVAAAMDALSRIDATVLAVRSGLYRSPPMGPQDQPDYVNAAAGLLTRLPPGELLLRLQAIENDHGRVRSGERWGPRTLDMDLLVYGAETCTDASLQLPHPGIADRPFVLLPLREIAPGLNVPGLGSVARLARRFRGDEIERIEPAA
jgi:2-amino-4-hydroxy-6-hydroxymethyldihydropteridine diphosphokinase